MTTSDYVIETSGLTKKFRSEGITGFWRSREEDVLALDNVSLNVARGEIIGLIGPNGAGKTTLIKILTTLLLPSSGSARIEGHDIQSADFEVRKRVGLVTSNERSFYWRLTGRQNMTFFADLYHIPRDEARCWIDELFDVLDLSHMADQRFDSYSTGMKQRLAMARGLLSRPSIVFMDEPTKGVDPIGSDDIIDLIRQRLITLWNPTILITSHNLREIERLCSRIALLNRGRIIAAGDISELRRMARGGLTYEMRVRKLSELQLVQILKSSGMGTPRIISSNGTVDFAIDMPAAAGLSDMLGRILGAGGQIEACSETQTAFEDVFRTLVANEGSGS